MKNEDLPKGKAPCRGCDDRTVGCHSQCDKYIQFKKKIDERNDAKYKERLSTYYGRGDYTAYERRYIKWRASM